MGNTELFKKFLMNYNDNCKCTQIIVKQRVYKSEAFKNRCEKEGIYKVYTIKVYTMGETHILQRYRCIYLLCLLLGQVSLKKCTTPNKLSWFYQSVYLFSTFPMK